MNKKLIALLALCISAGIASAVLSLIISSVFEPFLNKILSGQVADIAGLIILEELSKFAVVWIIFYLLSENFSFLKSVFYSIFLAIGFSLFETALIFASQDSLNVSIIFVFFVHLITLLIWLWAIYFAKIKKDWLLFAIFALILSSIHLVYNLFALNNF